MVEQTVLISTVTTNICHSSKLVTGVEVKTSSSSKCERRRTWCKYEKEFLAREFTFKPTI
jgi:hypothetical protein